MSRFSLLFLFFSAFVVLAFAPFSDEKSSQYDELIIENNIKLTPEQAKALDEHRALEAKYNVRRGSRPPIDLDKVSKDSYEKGVLRIKLMPWAEKSLDKRFIHAGKNGYVQTGVKALDDINKSIGAHKYERGFDNLYEVANPGNVKKYEERHQAWGFHLIRDIHFDAKTDVIEAVKQFEQLDQVEYAEPVYKTRLIEPIHEEGRDKNSSTKSSRRNDPGSWSHDIEPKLNPDDPDYGQQYAFPLINAPDAWEITTGNPDVVVAVLDEGIEYGHEDLEANIWPGIGPDGTNTDPGDHGTHVGGTVGAVTNNGIGVAGVAGGDGTPDSGVKLMSLNIFGQQGDYEANVYAADNDAMISQNSWGYGDPGVYNQSALDGIDYFNENGGGTALDGGLTIFAAGNDNDDGDWYPAYYGHDDPDVLGAMAVASTDVNDVKSNFSNYGDWIDISAPGSNIYSTWTGDGYNSISGTSMACPHVSGVASAIVSITEGLMTNEELWQLLIENVENIDDENPNYIGLLGSGRLDFKAAADEGDIVAGGIVPPRNFEAVSTGLTSIYLSWELNDNNDEVLLAYVEDGDSFGSPDDGATYTAGDQLPGGGEVLYVGTDLSYSHTDLNDATFYNYRAYSIAGAGTEDYNEGDYSNFRSTSTHTDCGSFMLDHHQDFSEGVPPFCWQNIDADGDGHAWFAGGEGNDPYEGNMAAVSASWQGGDILYPDNWLITPRFDITSNDLDMSYWVKAQDGDWPAEHYSIMVSTTGTNLDEDFTEIFSETLNSAEWAERNIDIAAELGLGEDLAGNHVYIAFRHHDCSDMFQIVIDNIDIVEGESVGEIYTIEASTGPGGSMTPEGSVSVIEGNDRTFTMEPNDGFTVLDVVVDGSSVGAVDSYTFTNIQSDGHTIHATFEEYFPELTVNINPGGAGTVDVDPDEAHYTYGTEVTLTPSANANYEFSHFSGDVYEADPCVEAEPFTENFANDVLDPETGACWTNVNTGGLSNPWVIDGGSALFDGTNQGNAARLITPPIDLKWYESATLTFDVQRPTDGGGPNRDWDELYVEYYDGSSWEHLASYTDNEGDGWNDKEINLPAAAFYHEVEIGFRAVASGRNATFTRVDNVEITGTPDPAIDPDAIWAIMDEDRTITANFDYVGGDPLYTLTVEANPAAGGNPTGGGDYEEGATVPVEANTSAGYNFINWTVDGGEVSTQENFDYTMPGEATTLVANFEEETVEPTYMLTVDADPVDGGNPSGAGDYEEGTTVYLDANPNADYHIAGWYEDNTDLLGWEETGQVYTMPGVEASITARYFYSVEQPLLGDVNNDGSIDVLDIVWIVNYIMGEPHEDFIAALADANEDGLINISDVAFINDLILGGAKQFDEVNSQTAYLVRDNNRFCLESDGTLSALQFRISADNPEQLVFDFMKKDNFEFAYSVKENEVIGVVYNFDNTTFPKGITDLMEIENLPGEVVWEELFAANIAGESVDVEPKDVPTNIFTPDLDAVQLNVFPNPNTGTFTAAIELDFDAMVEMQLFDIMGRNTSNIPSTRLHKGENHIRVNENLSKGLYLLKINVFDQDGKQFRYTREVRVLVE